jgi:tagaturonate reductase
MKLNKEVVLAEKFPGNFSAPYAYIFDLPEKVLQFGTGVLLRGLPDFYIDKANKQKVFNGRIVMVKSTGSDVDKFISQDGIFTQCIKGIVDGKAVEEYIINASISKTLSAKEHWDDIIKYAERAHMQIIISNTTEVGIILKEDDDIYSSPPESFPAKLLAFLYRRFQHFKGSEESGMVIIPTELIVDNGDKLKEIVLQLATINNLSDAFKNWINTANDFCNSLVDRIVPGSLKKEEQNTFEKLAGYSDELTIMSEPYSLWAIETSSEKTKELLSFYKTDNSVIITPDINKHRELKLRLLNGTHTFSCGVAYLSGFNFVFEALREKSMSTFIKKMMIEEIAPCITGTGINFDEAKAFAEKVIERFSNPYIEHKWLSITMQYSAKMKMRNMPLLLEWYKRKNKIPLYMAAGFAAYILFMKAVEKDNGSFYGMHNGVKYKITDDKAAYFYDAWKLNNADTLVEKILADKNLWSENLALLPGFSNRVKIYLEAFMKGKFKEVIEELNSKIDA